MAIETSGTIDAVLSRKFSKALTDTINRRTDGLRYIPIRPNDSGKLPTWAVKFSGTKGATVFAEGSDVQASEFDINPKKDAVLAWGNYRAPTQVTDLAVLVGANAGEGTADELVDLVRSSLGDSIKTLATGINKDLFIGTGTSGGNPNIVGLFGGAAAATGTYAGINRATYADWAGHVLGNGGVARPITDDLLRQAEQLVFNAGQEPPNLIFTTAGVHRKYAGIFESERRIITAGEAPAMLQKGTMQLYWGACPVVRDVHCPSGKLVMLNTDNVELVYPREFLAAIGMPRPNMEERPLTNGVQQLAVPVIVEVLARTGNSLKFNVWTHLQLRVRSPNGVVVIEDISE
jgi:hypothetical protein